MGRLALPRQVDKRRKHFGTVFAINVGDFLKAGGFSVRDFE